MTIHKTPSELEVFSRWYQPIHGVSAPIICSLGIVVNCLSIVVLTRKNMVNPTYVLLTGLAISDCLTMAAYLPFAILNYHLYPRYTPLASATYIMFFAIFSVIVHSISIWLTVSLAVFRYIFIRYPGRGAKLCSIQRANFTIAAVWIIVTIVCIPNSVSYYLLEDRVDETNTTSWYINVRDDTVGYVFLKGFNLWIQAILVRLLPCFLLAVFSILLIKQMKDPGRYHKTLLGKKGRRDADSEGHRKTNRTTRMIIAVLVLFFVTETPQGVLQLLGGIIDGFFDHVYSPLGDVMDTLALINNGINFVLYCTMSKQFRDTFIRIFLCGLVAENSKKFKRSTTATTTQPTRDTEV